MLFMNQFFRILISSCTGFLFGLSAFAQGDTIRIVHEKRHYQTTLTSQRVLLQCDTVNYFSADRHIYLNILNDSKDTVWITRVVNSDGAGNITISEPPMRSPVLPGMKLETWIVLNERYGRFHKNFPIYYRVNAASETHYFIIDLEGVQQNNRPVRPETDTLKRASSGSGTASVQTPTSALVKTKYQQPAQSSQTHYRTRPDGINRLGEGEVTIRVPGNPVYDFVLEDSLPPPPYPFKEKVVQQIFSWDTISSLTQPLVFRMHNDSDQPIYIEEMNKGGYNVFFARRTSMIIPARSVLEIAVFVNAARQGHFYETLEIKYRSGSESKKFTIPQWGFISQNAVITIPEHLQFDKNHPEAFQKALPEKSMRIYATNGHQNVSAAYRLRLFDGQKTTYAEVQTDDTGDTFFEIPEPKRGDTLLIEIVHPELGVMAKVLLSGKQNRPNVHIFVQEELIRSGSFTYTLYGGIQQYREPIAGVYMLDWNKRYGLETIKSYLAKFGLQVDYKSDYYVRIDSPQKAHTLQQQFLKSAYDVHLLPILEYSSINSHGWGGGGTWYSNSVQIVFHPSVSEVRIREIFKSAGISNYMPTGNDYNGLKVYSFELPDITSPGYYASGLWKLWSFPEVVSIGQQFHSKDSLD